RRESTRVRALDHDHAHILPELPGELPVADVERDHPPRAALEQAVGEATRRGADVERDQVARLEAEGVERPGQLLAASAHVGGVGAAQPHQGVGEDLRARLGDGTVAHEHVARHDEAPGALAARAAAARAPASPSTPGYVALPSSRSVRPSASGPPAASRMSSAIWKASPRCSPYAVSRRSVRPSAPATSAPTRTAPRRSAPVFRRWMSCTRRRL